LGAPNRAPLPAATTITQTGPRTDTPSLYERF
jgi:hypothetical protein